MMFQSYALFPHMNVERNIAFGLRQEGWPRARTPRGSRRCCALVQLEGSIGGGRISCRAARSSASRSARALAKRPKLLLLDEPLAALDRKLREETQFELKRVQRRLGTAFVVVTHDQEEAMVMADRAWR